jgi:signal transduction histidine kinase
VDPCAVDPLCEDGVAQVVHDMKSPLTTISLETSLLDHRLAAGESMAASDSLARIHHNVLYLDRMVQDLLDVATIKHGSLTLSAQHCELRSLISGVIERAVPTHQQFRVFLEAPEPVYVMADDLRLERVISNLIDNALKYTPASSGVAVRMIRAGVETIVSVTDAGPGIPEAQLATVFEPFTRTETSRGRPGTGLGLYVSKKIIEAHGGRIGVDSVCGFGSRFFFTLPALDD